MTARQIVFSFVMSLIGSCALAETRVALVERALTDATLDLGTKGDSVGDLLTFANPLYDANNQVQVGTDQGYCVRVQAGKSWECTWTVLLKEGQISVEGPFNDVGDSVLAVIGGAGKYQGAKGSLLLHPRDAKSSAYDFICVLT